MLFLSEGAPRTLTTSWSALAAVNPVLNPGELAAIRAVAVRPGTWHRRPAGRADQQALQHNFSAIHLLVNQARRRRAAWALALPAAVLATLVNGAAILPGLGLR